MISKSMPIKRIYARLVLSRRVGVGSEVELAAMRRAIAISAQGLGTTSPNPPVGCVILDKAGVIVGEGYHRRKGEAHAEVNALKAAGVRALGGTAVVTLEPCNHYGRTPPCRQALLDAGVSRVVVALLDPTSRGEGGVAALRAAGVSVDVGVGECEALVVLGQWRRSLEGGPQVTWLYALSGEGVPIAPPPGSDAGRDAAVFLRVADLVVDEQLSMAEGQPGGHDWTLSEQTVPEYADPVAFLARIAEIGARTVTVVGGTRLAVDLSRAGLLARSVSYLPCTNPSDTPHWAPGSSWPSSGHHIVDVLALPGWVRVTTEV